MSVATSTAIGIAAAASAGASVAGAKMASNSAKNAAKVQTAAADKAAALNAQAWQQQQALQQPYQQAGRTATNNLAALMNPGVPYTPEMQAQNQQRSQLPPPMGAPMPQQAMPRAGMMPPQGPQGPQGAPMPGPPQGNPLQAAMSPQAPGQTVLMDIPGRGRQPVPRQMMAQALAAGGRMVG